MDDQPTCGKGIAANAPLPDHLGRMAAATADVLEAHLPMLDVTDPHSAEEHALYVWLIEEHRRAAHVLQVVAERMAGARDLPMGRHVHAPAASVAMERAFTSFVASEAELHASLEARLAQDRAMLAAMRESASGDHAAG
jgi:hypothetical protein